jgi:hypothetical protein
MKIDRFKPAGYSNRSMPRNSLCAPLLLVALLAFESCRVDRSDSPEEAYRLFSAALKHSDVNTAWESLSQQTRAVLEQKSKAVAAASKGAIKDDPKLLSFVSGIKVQPIGEVKVLRADAQSALLEVGEDSGKREQKMVKVGNRWYVDLTDSLKSGAAAP